MKLYKPESYNWQMCAVINEIIRDYDHPSEEEVEPEYNPFERHDPWQMRIIYSPNEEQEENLQLELEPSEPLGMDHMDWQWWSEQLFC